SQKAHSRTEGSASRRCRDDRALSSCGGKNRAGSRYRGWLPYCSERRARLRAVGVPPARASARRTHTALAARLDYELASSSGAPCRRSNCGRFCEKADRGSTMSHPTSCAFCFKSPCTCDRKPMIDVPFLSLVFSLGIRVSGLALTLLRSKMISEGFSSPFCFM